MPWVILDGVYTPAHFAMPETESREQIVAAGAGLLVVHHPEQGFDAAMIPLHLDGDRLLGHVAKANPIWRTEGPVLAVFTPVDGYVSPSWYPSKAEHGKVVPTWNYVTVHVHGTMRAHQDPEWLRGVVTSLTDEHEARTGTGWKVTDAPDSYIEGLLKAIVGIEIAIERIEGKAKLSQNKPADDVAGVIAARPDALGAAMRKAAGT